jgi:hypothetical protein
MDANFRAMGRSITDAKKLEGALRGQETRIALAIGRIERGESGAALTGLQHAMRALDAALATLSEQTATTPETDTLAEALGASEVRQYGSHDEAVRAEMKRRTTPETDHE